MNREIGSGSKKPAAKLRAVSDPTKTGPRKVKQPTYKAFRISKRIRQPKPRLTGAFRLFITSTKLLLKNWKLFGGIVLIYLLLTIVLVKGFGVSSGIGNLANTIEKLSQGSIDEFATGVALFSVLLLNANSTSSEVAGAYQSMLLIIISLAIIWALRHTLATRKVTLRIRDAFYKSATPFVAILLVLLVIGLQLVPIITANFLFTTVIAAGLPANTLEQGFWLTLLALLAILSLYMVTSSVFALYIVTLPDVTPMQALRSARELVRYRRWVIMRKVLFLPFALLFLAALLVVPVIIVSPNAAEWLFFVLSMMALAIGHSYMYHLYRELL